MSLFSSVLFLFLFVESGGGLVGVVALCGGVGLVGGGSKMGLGVKLGWGGVGGGVYPQEGTKRGTFSARLHRVRHTFTQTCTFFEIVSLFFR